MDMASAAPIKGEAKESGARAPSLPDRWLNRFIPRAMREDEDARRRARLLVEIHSFAPAAGFLMLSDVYRLKPEPGLYLWIPVACLAAMWTFLPALRRSGKFQPLAFASVQLLAFVVLFTSYQFGGIASPFLPWILATPLLAFGYFGGNARLGAVAVAGVAVQFVVFLVACELGDPPWRVPLDQLREIGIFSLFCAGIFATAAAADYARLNNARAQTGKPSDRELADIALREAREAAETASRLRTDFLASISHQLRTPLNAVVGFSELMKNETFGPVGNDRYRGYARDIYDSGSHLHDIVSVITDVANGDSAKFELQEEVFDVRELIVDAAKSLRPRMLEAGLSLEWHLPRRIHGLRADRRRVTQVFLNLIENAMKCTPQGGKIWISAASDEHHGLSVTVHHGGGAKDDLAAMAQGVRTGRKEADLGLMLVDVMMHRHGGRFEFDTEPGTTATARVVFPSQRLEATGTAWGASPAPTVRRKREAGETPTVLVVDDDENLRTLFARILARGGYRTITAMDGYDALKCFRSQAIDVVVTDMIMPGMDGAELMRQLAEDRPEVPVVAISGADECRRFLRGAANDGAYATLSKPFPARQLLQVVNRSLNGAPMDAVA